MQEGHLQKLFAQKQDEFFASKFIGYANFLYIYKIHIDTRI